MTSYDFILFSLLASGGEVQGRTKLQKSLFFIGALTGVLEDLNFHSHFYGPYSEEIASSLTRLKAHGLVTESSSYCNGLVGPERAQHKIMLSDEGREVAKMKADRNQEGWKRVSRATEILAQAGDLDYMELSFAAKAFFQSSPKGSTSSEEELRKHVQNVGWGSEEHEIQKSMGFLSRLGLSA